MTTDSEEPAFTILILARAPQLVHTSADSWLQRSQMIGETSGIPHAQNTLPGDGWYRLRRGLCQHGIRVRVAASPFGRGRDKSTRMWQR